MIERGNKSKLTALAGMVVAVSLAACGKVEPARNDPRQTKAELDNGYLVVRGGEEDFAETTLPAIVERRHFAIYSTYRVLFDDSASVYQSPVPSQDDAVQPALMASDGGIPACSMRAILLQD